MIDFLDSYLITMAKLCLTAPFSYLFSFVFICFAVKIISVIVRN